MRRDSKYWSRFSSLVPLRGGDSAPRVGDAKRRRGGKAIPDKLDHLLDAEAVRDHKRLGAAVARRGQQLERAAAVGLGAVATAAGLGHGVGGRWLNWGREDTTRPGAKAAVAAACALFRRDSQLRDTGPILDLSLIHI